MKNKLLKSFKIGILTFGLPLLFWNCDKNEDITAHETPQERTMTEISFEDFKSNSRLNKNFQSLNPNFGIDQLSAKSNLNQKSLNDFDNAIILTDKIIKIKKNGFTTYTFTIFTQTENDEFYNLVLYVNENQEIYKSYILKYTPSEKWLANINQPFSGNVKIINNDVYNLGNLLQSKKSHSAKSNANDDCAEVVMTYECSHGVEGHRQDPRSSGCTAQDFYVYLDIISVPCSTVGGDDGFFDTSTGAGTTTSGGSDGGIITAPNTVPYTAVLKNFESGLLNINERNYYHSNSNIKNTIDLYLIQKNFSDVSKYDAKSALNFGHSIGLNFQQFDWVFNNRGSEDLNAIQGYLIDIGSITPKIKGFIKEAIDSEIETNNSAKVDFDDQIIDELEGIAKCIYEKLKISSTGFKNSIKKFDGEFPVSHLKFTINNNLETAVYGKTHPPINYITEVEISNNALQNLSDLGKAMVFAHEIIHAEIFRKMLSAAKLGTLEDVNNMNAQEQTNYVNSLRNNFPGLYDYYYRRYKPTWNHEMMANHYRSTITDMIQQFDNNRLPRSTYEDITWVGLGKLDTNITTIAWDNLSPEAKARINRLISENFYNGPKNCN